MDESQNQKLNAADRNNLRRWILKAVKDSMPTGTTMQGIKKFLDAKKNGLSVDLQTKLTFKQLLQKGVIGKGDKSKYVLQQPQIVKLEKPKRTAAKPNGNASKSPHPNKKEKLPKNDGTSHSNQKLSTADLNNIRRWILKAVKDAMPTGTTMQGIKKFLDSKRNGLSDDLQTQITFKQLLQNGVIGKGDKFKYVLQQSQTVKLGTPKRTAAKPNGNAIKSPHPNKKEKLPKKDGASHSTVDCLTNQENLDVSSQVKLDDAIKSPHLNKKKKLPKNDGASHSNVDCLINQDNLDISNQVKPDDAIKLPDLNKKKKLPKTDGASHSTVDCLINMENLDISRQVKMENSTDALQRVTNCNSHQSSKSPTDNDVKPEMSCKSESKMSSSRSSKRSLDASNSETKFERYNLRPRRIIDYTY